MIRRLLCAAALLAAAPVLAQTDTTDNLLDALGTDGPKHPPVIATFKATRLVNGATVEQVAHGVLDFRILHRFNTLNNGLYDLFGLDGAVTKLAFDYGVTDWLMVGFGRSTLDKEYDGSVRVKLLRQTEDNHMPVSVSYAGAMGVVSQRPDVPEGMEYYFSNRLAFTNQILIARKFGERFSLQLSPSVVHYNLVPTKADPNTIYALGVGGRLKLTRRFSLNAEWFPVLGDRLSGTTDALSLGVDIETGGHVFQLHFTNATGMTERTFIGQTTGTWGNSDIRFGFNISRVFTLVKPKVFRGS